MKQDDKAKPLYFKFPQHLTKSFILNIIMLIDHNPEGILCLWKFQYFSQIWSFLDCWFGRYILSKNWNSHASKLIQDVYNHIKTIDNKVMISALAPATLWTKKDPKLAKFGHFCTVISAIKISWSNIDMVVHLKWFIIYTIASKWLATRPLLVL